MTADEEATRAVLQAELDGIEETYAGPDDLPEEIDQRIGEIETALAGFDERPVVFDSDEVVRAGAFVSIDSGGNLRVERGYVRPEDELPVAPEPEAEVKAEIDGGEPRSVTAGGDDDNGTIDAEPEVAPEPEEDEGIKPIPERLMTELTAHRTLALRHALGGQPDVAFLAALHALCLKAFYPYALDTCLDLDIKSVGFHSQAPGLNDSALATAMTERHQSWAKALPKEASDLWTTLTTFDGDSRQALFAHCVSLSVNAMFEAYNRKPKALAHADRLAHTRNTWRPRSGSMVNRKHLTAAMIDSRDFLSARRRAETEVMLPAGPKVAFTGGMDCNDTTRIWDVLDRVHAKHPSMVLLHGGSPKGAERIAACWADNRKVTQVAFKPDWTRHAKAAPFKRNDQLLDVLPIGVVVFPGSGISDNLADKARKLGIPLFDFRKRPD